MGEGRLFHVVVPSPSAISYTLNDTVVTNATIPVLQPFQLVAHSKTDFYLYEVSPSFPSFIHFDGSTGNIAGFSAGEMEPTRFTISGHSVTSVVVSELVLAFSLENGTVVSGEAQAKRGIIRVYEEWERNREMSSSEQLVMEETVEGHREVGALVMDSEYDVCIEDIE